MRKILILVFSTALVAGAVFFMSKERIPEAEEAPEQALEEKQTQAVKAPAPKKEPMLILSDALAEQSDTLVASVQGVAPETIPQGTFLSREVSFFPVGDSWLAILGVDARRAPGMYVLEVQGGDGEAYTKEVVVSKRDFPITKLALTPELKEKGYTPTNIAQNIAVVENKALQDVLGGYTPIFHAGKEFFYPLDIIEDVGAYGNIRQSGSVSLQHLGVDLEAKTGTPVYAVNDGSVVLQRDFVNYGNTLVIDHGFGIYSLYLHLDEAAVEPGEFVSRGQVIAHSGNTGYSIAPHLHFSMKVAGESVDPLRFIETVNRELLFLAR